MFSNLDDAAFTSKKRAGTEEASVHCALLAIAERGFARRCGITSELSITRGFSR
jgi:hypothetical protein